MKSKEITLQIEEESYPMLFKVKKQEFDDMINRMLDIGYNTLFPNVDIKIDESSDLSVIASKIDTLKSTLRNEYLEEKIETLGNSLEKLIGLSTSSMKKGELGENMLEEIITKRYGDIEFKKTAQQSHAGDAWLYLPDKRIIMLESKNYQTNVARDEVTKMENDMITNHIKWGIFTSLNSGIQGLKSLDFHTFTHHNETYCIVLVSNLSQDICKLDLALEITRKMMYQFDDIKKFPWLIEDIKKELVELDQIVQKNYQLRDNYYTMEREIQKAMNNHYTKLRDYQYEIEQHTKLISRKITNTIEESVYVDNDLIKNNLVVLDCVDNKKSSLRGILEKIIDTISSRKWILELTKEKTYKINTIDKQKVGSLVIQLKKILVEMDKNDLVISFNISKDKENSENLELIKNFKI